MSSAGFRRGPKHERGFALILVVALVVLLSSYFLIGALNRSSSQIATAREQNTMNSLLKAKAALIAYAASEQWQLYKGQSTNQPGALPCPDQDDDGDADCIGAGITNSISLVGRLPWKTLGTDDLRDSSGERLWYAVSRNFRKLYGTTVVNSDSQGQLSITGTTSGSNIVAVVIAPGDALAGENRVASHNSVSAYLEGFNAADNVNFVFTTNARPSDILNDRLVAITQADLMAAVEPVVSARIERDVKPYLQAYFNQWGAFPFPAKFANPDPGTNGAGTTRPQAAAAPPDYTGDPTQSAGLLPLTTLASVATPYPWSSGSATKQPGGFARVDNDSCTTASLPSPFPPPATGWRCTFRVRTESVSGVDVIFFPHVRVTGDIGTNAGVSLATLPDASSVTTTIDGASAAVTSPTIRGTLLGTGAGTVSYDATLPISCLGCSDRTVVITIPDVTVSRVVSAAESTVTAASNATPIVITTSAPHNFPTGAAVTVSGISGNAAANGTWTITVVDATRFSLNTSSGSAAYTSGGTASAAAWFIANEWFRQTYYVVSPGYVPGGSGGSIGCVARPAPPAGPVAPSCLRVSNLDPTRYPVADDKRAILILAGRSLTGNARPSSSLAEYLDGANAPLVAAPYVFEHRPGGPTSINDRVVVVSP